MAALYANDVLLRISPIRRQLQRFHLTKISLIVLVHCRLHQESSLMSALATAWHTSI